MTVTYVQENIGDASTNPSGTAYGIAGSPAVGHKIITGIGTGQGMVVTAIVDNGSDVWTIDRTDNSALGIAAGSSICSAPITGAPTTLTPTITTAGNIFNVFCEEFAGVSGAGYGANGMTGSSTSFSLTSGASVNDGDLVCVYCELSSTGHTFTKDAAFTFPTTGAAGLGASKQGFFLYQIVSGTASITCACSWVTAATFAVSMVAFPAAAPTRIPRNSAVNFQDPAFFMKKFRGISIPKIPKPEFWLPQPNPCPLPIAA